MKKVLVVEDNQDLQFILTSQIKSMGFSVITANNGTEAVEKTIEEKPHLILMDIMLPGMDGREATRRIRYNPETKDIPILAATAITNKSQLRECIEAGCNEYITKPFTFKELQTKVQNFVPSA